MKFDYEEDFLDDEDLDDEDLDDEDLDDGLFNGHTIIQCNDNVKNEIKETLLRELGDMMKEIREDADAVSAIETENGVEVYYPCGEIYGYASDYVQAVPHVFKQLKKTYPDIAIWGIVYEYETVQAATFGPLFYCSADDTELTVTYEWQECVSCGKILESDTLYNSSQRDFGEGNLFCLCSPTCMLEYSLKKGFSWQEMLGGGLEPNASFDENEMDVIRESYENEEDDEDEDEYTVLKELLWKRVTENLEEYIDDFKENYDRIVTLSNKDSLTAKEKDILLSIVQRIKI